MDKYDEYAQKSFNEFNKVGEHDKDTFMAGFSYGALFCEMEHCNIKLRNSKNLVAENSASDNSESEQCQHSYKRVSNSFMFEKSVCEKCGHIELC